MSKYEAIKAATNAYIKTNGRREITGAILNAVMISTIDSLGRFYQFVGNAEPNTDPGVIDQNIAYLASTPGTYTHLGGFTLDPGEFCVLKYDGQWRKESLVTIPTLVSQLANDAGFVTNAVADLVNYFTKEETYSREEMVSVLSSYYDKDEIDSIVSAISGSSYAVSWDGTAEPIVSDIPAGVVVTYGGNPYTGTLAPSDDTKGKIYLVKNGAYYDMYVTAEDSGFSWAGLGSTSIDLTGYATTSITDELEDQEKSLGAFVTPVIETYTKKESVDLTGLTLLNYSIRTDGTYGTGPSYKHNLVSITPGKVAKVTADAGSLARFCFVKSTAAPVSGGAIDLCVGSSVIDIPAGETRSFLAPSDSVGFLIYRGSSPYPYTPAEIIVSTAIGVIDNLVTEDPDAPLSANQGVVLEGKNYDVNFRLDMQGLHISNNRDLSILTLQNYYINPETLKWNTSSAYKHKTILVSEGERILVTANETRYARVAFLTSNSVTAGDDAPFVPGTSIITIPAGKSMVLEIPAGCSYFYYYCGLVEGGVEPFSPDSISVLDVDGVATKEEVEFQHQIDVDNAELLYYYVTATGKWSSNGYHRHIVIPVNGGEKYTIVADPDYYTYLSYLTTKGSVTSGADAPLVPDTPTRIQIVGGARLDIVVPTGCKYLCFMATSSQTEYTQSHRLRSPQSVIRTELVKDVVAGMVGQSGSILALNPDSEWTPKMMSAQKRYYTTTDSTEPNPLVILHLSDIHGNWTNVRRFTEFCDRYSSFINMRLNTGDTVADDYDDGVAGYDAIPGVEKIINIIGNHDSSRYDGGVRDWNYYCGLPCYTTFIAPYVDGWGVVQPEDADVYGYCYFYKDYAEKNIRVVFVDIMAYDDTENAWLASVLADALANDYHIVIATHYAGVRKSADSSLPVFEKIPCNYTTLYSMGGNSTNLTPYNYSAYKMMIAVDDFMQAGGHFVGYIQGHYHADFVAKCAEFPSQLIYAIGSSKSGEVRDYKHTIGTRFQDEFQVVSIDTKNTIVKIFKVGANIDRYGRTKGSVCINYTTGEVLGEGMF